MTSPNDQSGNPLVIYTDRSRQLSYQSCPRKRWLNYHFDGTGLQPNKLIIPLATGIYTHEGLAELLSGAPVETAIGNAVKAYWDEIKRRGIDIEPGMEESYVADEQTALVEGMLRAYSLRKLPELLEQFEVMEVEKEELWPLVQGGGVEIMMQGRLDALLRDKVDNGLYIQSYKTAASYDRRTAAEAEHDVQGLSELAAVEYRLTNWWNHLNDAAQNGSNVTYGIPERMVEFLRGLPEPPKISGVRMEYLLKGRRAEYPEGSGTYVQYSPLIRGYVKYAPVSGADEYGWKREYKDENGQTKRLDYRTWKEFKAWQSNGGVKAWIELLASGDIQPEAGDPLSTQFITPVPYFRQDDDLRDWYQQTAHQEMVVGLNVLETAEAEAKFGLNSFEYRSALNLNFPQNRRSCDWPSSCQYIDICYSTNVKADPIGSGLFMRREPHHAPEAEAQKKAGKTMNVTEPGK